MALMEFIIPDKIAPVNEIGGKATNLFSLARSGLEVPAWIVIPDKVLQGIIIETDNNNPEITRNQIANYNIPDSFISSITAHFDGEKYFAVRSSAIDEDGTDYSFAGQFESYLYVPKSELADKIKRVWFSALSPRVMAYRERLGLKEHPGIAVIIQKMVNATSSGVAFGIDPINGDRDAKVINAVFGLGEGLVSGDLNADYYKIKNGVTNSQIVAKTHKLILNESGQLAKIKLDESLANTPALIDSQIFEISDTLDTLKQKFGKAQDIEFAIENDKLYLLQSRPVTGLDKLRDPDGDFIIWDNSNIIESYPGVTTPLTFSFIIKVYEAVYKQLSGIMGVSKADIDANENVFANMLGLLNGRVYYNLLSWYKLLAMLPGYSMNAEFMERMMGVKQRFELKDVPKHSKLKERIRVLNMVRIMLRNLHTLPKQRKEFVNDFNEVMTSYQDKDFNAYNTQELMRMYFNFEGTLLKKWKAPLVNDFFAMIYFGVLQKLITTYKLNKRENIHNDLLCGAGDIISTQPVKKTQLLAGLILKNKESSDLFLSHGPMEIWAELRKGKYELVRKEIDLYLFQFGERVVGELKLETISYKQNPVAFIKILKSFCQNGLVVRTSGNNQDAIRRKAEDEIRILLKGNLLKKLILNYFLKKSRSLVSNRENLRYERTRAFGIVREIFSAIGKRFYAENLIEDERDIFYLKKEEIFEFIEGTSVNANLKELISIRKAEFKEFENMPSAERITTYGIVYQGNEFKTNDSKPLQDGDLKGIGCCPGRIKAKVRVLRSPEEMDSMEGDILVTSSTDPGWVILFPTVSAILVERGSLLSHSAIVSREMGIPCIVGINGLLETLHTGDMVEMDGSTGIVKLIKRFADE